MLKNVVVLNDFAQVNGGASQVALSGAIGLARRGYRVILFSAVGPLNEAAAAAGVNVICTYQQEVVADPNRLRAVIQGVWNSRARTELRDVLRSLDPSETVVHVHSWIKALSSSVIREAIDQDFTVACTLHDYFSACPNGGFFDYQIGRPCGETALSLGCVLRNCDARSYSQKLWRVARQTVQKSFGGMPRDIRHFISVSEFSERILRAYLPSKASVDRVRNPIDVAKNEAAEVSDNDSYMYVGRLSSEKGVSTFAEAASKARVRAIFVGDGPAADQIRAANADAQITGWLPREQVVRHIRSARALVMPSLLYETQGLTVAEAAAQGVPAIVSDLCAATEAVANGKTGLWFTGGDASDLAMKIGEMAKPGVATILGRNSYDTFWANPTTITQHVGELELVFNRYLSQRPVRRHTTG